MFIFYMSIILVTAFFIIFGYYTQLDLQEKRQYDKLKGIVSSTAAAIEGDEHQIMMEEHPEKDAIVHSDENMTYHHIHMVLSHVAQANGLKTAMYTMVYMPEKNVFEFGVTSDENPYFRHAYTDFPAQLVENMETGGTIPMYEDEHGMWLSAFHPVKNADGKTVALLQADVDFSEFIYMVRAKYTQESLIALGAIILLAIVLLPYTRRVLKEEERQKEKMKIQAEIIEEKNRDITDSINYALKIQNTILPKLTDFTAVFNDFGLLYKPKDIVAGDFYYLERKGDDIFVAAADCTGHGVPGAMVSVICSNAMSYAINESGLTSTGQILDKVREYVVEKFQGSPDGIKDGMDVSLCRFNLKTKEVEYSGANNPIYILKAKTGEMESLSPDKQPVGQFDHAVPFNSQKLILEEGDLVYLFTDGYADQFGGEKGKKLKYKPFKEMLQRISNQALDKQMHELGVKFEEWRGDFEQVDDVCVIGVRV